MSVDINLITKGVVYMIAMKNSNSKQNSGGKEK